jgi:DNA-directed RNA polymerase specialized sigma24 family protein
MRKAEEAVQAGYVRAFTHLAGFKGEASLATWLARIVLNEAKARLRRRGSTVNIEEVSETRAEVEAATHVAGREPIRNRRWRARRSAAPSSRPWTRCRRPSAASSSCAPTSGTMALWPYQLSH